MEDNSDMDELRHEEVPGFRKMLLFAGMVALVYLGLIIGMSGDPHIHHESPHADGHETQSPDHH